MAMPRTDIDYLLEQLDAAGDVIQQYRCVSCQIATAQHVMLILKEEEGGVHVTIVGICDTCNTTERNEP